jgi:5-methyltetrahydrofolate--homocysteine methyltransferase
MIDLTRCRLFDGGMGTMLQAKGLQPGECPERLNIERPDVVRSVHRAYVQAGADFITANTFGASRRKLGEDPAPYIAAGVRLAKEAGAPWVALDIGPLGGLLEPFGDMSFQDAYDQFAQIVAAGAEAGADVILIETMSDLLEAKAALLAAREHSSLPVFATMTFGEDGRTFLGTDPRAAAVTLTSLGADVIGVNCSLGPKALLPVVSGTHLPVMVQPNAGLPRLEGERTVYDVTAEDFAQAGGAFLDAGAAILGGCCGTAPEHIAALKPLVSSRRPIRRPAPEASAFCGWQGVVTLGEDSIYTVGERINPTGRPAFRKALYEKDYDYAASVAISEQEEGADFLVVNAGLPDIDQEEALPALVLAIQEVSPLPLVIDCSEPSALEKALRVCRGRPILNSVNGRADSMEAMLPLAAKYGTGLVALTLNENGISDDPEVRRDMAVQIARRAEEAGVPRNSIFVDCLALAASVSGKTALATPETIRLVRAQGLRTILGVSNVSHGLPGRDALNCAYLSACLAAGLNVAIVNTGSERVMDALASARVLVGEDPGCQGYIARFQGAVPTVHGEGESLKSLIVSGQRGQVPAATQALLEKEAPLDIISGHIVPALDLVGQRYETGEMFLPQLMAAAEAVKAAFSVLEKVLPRSDTGKGTILLATVQGDVHDIGKNVVRMLLENYGYRVVDLGRDVPPETVVAAVRETGAPLVGLSSLMTTTAKNMAVTVKALRQSGLSCKIMVGGAVVTEGFARSIGADYYAKDAAQSARIAQEVFGS